MSITEEVVVVAKEAQEEEGGGDGLHQSPEATQKVIAKVVKEPVLRHGSKGEKYSAIANLIRIHAMKDYGMYEYDVRFQPPVDAVRFRKDLLRKSAELIGTIYNYDGAETLYLPIKLDSQVKTLTIEGEIETIVRFTFRRERSLDECSHFYNILFERIMYLLNFQRIGRKFFDPVAPKMIPQHKLQGNIFLNYFS